jgi:4-hydroxybenzoate polyprenyltransferase
MTVPDTAKSAAGKTVPATGALPDVQRSGHWVDRSAPEAFRPYLKLARIDRPIGWWLLLLPCWWANGLAVIAVGPVSPPLWPMMLWHGALFMLGAIVMRGAGCTFNDIVDRDLDAKVTRTRNRPLPSGAVKPWQAALFMVALAFTGLAVLLQFNRFTIWLGIGSLVIVAVYPFMKRITNMPQLVLGLAFSWGALVGWSAIHGQLAAPALLAYAAAVLWTIAYDTIYAMQDIEDDEMVGIKSSARLFKGHTVEAVAVLYAGAVICLGMAAFKAGGGWISLAGIAGFAGHLGWQAARVKDATPAVALELFRSNRNAGLIPALAFMAEALVRTAS